MGDEHLKYLWAAYRRGAFEKSHIIDPGFDPDGFKASLLAFAGRIFQAGGELFVFMGHTPLGVLPVGLTIKLVNGIYCEPHVVWFPEASGRNRLELALGFLVELKRRYKVLLWVREANWNLYDHLCKYGVIRTVGKVKGYFPDGENAFLFQGVV